jgi:hypothetical protein
MSDITLTTVDALMKELYPGDKPMNVAMIGKPALSWVPKKDGMVGDNLVIPITYGHGAGRSSTFSTAQTNAAGGKHLKFQVDRESDYAVLTITAETMRSSKNNIGAFVEARKWEVDGHLDLLGRSAAKAFFSTTGGTIARCSSGNGTDTITLTNADDTRYFEVGMKIQFATTEAATTLRDSGEALTVEAIDRDAGTVTFDPDYTTIASIDVAAPGDYMLVEGDAATKMTGVKGWLPLTAPTAGDSFFGVDRSVDTVRLAGERLDNSGSSIEDNLLVLCEKIASNGGRPDTCFINHTNFSTLVRSLGAKVEYQDFGGTAKVGFDGVSIHTGAGKVKVIPDPWCPGDRGYVLQRDTWRLWHLDGFPHIVKDDGLMALRQSSSDGVEIRMRYWGNYVCRAPGYNGVFSI